MKKTRLRLLVLTAASCVLTFCWLLPGRAQFGGGPALPIENPRAHDPSRITACEGKFYFYYTGDRLPMRTSDDLIHWLGGPPVLDKVPDEIHKLVPDAKGEFIWAPDVIKVDREYWLFYSYSTFGSRVSAIGLVSSLTLNPESPTYKWTDRGVVIATNNDLNYNAIDPAPIWDEAGHLWLTFGSWQRDGIQVVQLDARTGKPIGPPATIAAGQATGPEAAYLHFHDGYFYLFENEGDCCKGMNSTYRIMVGRSKTITGPYLDKDGKDLGKGGGSVFMETQGAEIGPGHVGIYGDEGVEHVTFHFYDGHANGASKLGIRSLVWGANAWPLAVPNLSGGRHKSTSLDGKATQDWNLISLSDGYFGLNSPVTGKYLTLTANKQIEMASWQNNDTQSWRIEAVDEGVYRIVSKTGHLALAAETELQAAAWAGSPSQQWKFTASSSN